MAPASRAVSTATSKNEFIRLFGPHTKSCQNSHRLNRCVERGFARVTIHGSRATLRLSPAVPPSNTLSYCGLCTRTSHVLRVFGTYLREAVGRDSRRGGTGCGVRARLGRTYCRAVRVCPG